MYAKRNYQNGYNRSDNGYNQQGGYSPAYQPRNQYAQQRPKKRSGAKFQMINNAPIVSAWRVQKGQMYALYARPYKGTKTVESKNGKSWINLFVTVTNRSTMQITKTSGMLDVQNKRMYIKEFNLIVTNKGQGGYFGKHISQTYNK